MFSSLHSGCYITVLPSPQLLTTIRISRRARLEVIYWSTLTHALIATTPGVFSINLGQHRRRGQLQRRRGGELGESGRCRHFIPLPFSSEIPARHPNGLLYHHHSRTTQALVVGNAPPPLPRDEEETQSSKQLQRRLGTEIGRPQRDRCGIV